MQSVAEIWNLIDAHTRPLDPVEACLDDALGCIVATAIRADADQPAFDRSAIDGFALPAHSEPGRYRIVGEIRPGEAALPAPETGQALRIFTGSQVPDGCELVMVEDTEFDGEWVRTSARSAASLIRRQGSSIQAGQQLIEAGSRLGAGEIALLASIGLTRPQVIPQPRILHLTTGSEVVAPERQPASGQIRNTNGPLIRALMREAGAKPLPGAHVDEESASLVNAVAASEPFDLLLVSGGSSVGDHDRTPQALAALGFDILARRVNAKPGKPLICARRGRQFAFGIPGNPVSHLAAWHVFIRRALERLAGRPTATENKAFLQNGATLRGDARETFWPARWEHQEGLIRVQPLPWLDSGDLSALRKVDALIYLPAGQEPPMPGSRVRIIPTAPRSRA